MLWNVHRYRKQGSWLQSALKNELEVLSELQPAAHPHIANLIELHEAANATHAVLQYCGGGRCVRSSWNTLVCYRVCLR